MAARLWLDWYTAQAVRTMRACGLRPILLKGPAVARLLYEHDPSSRPYTDADLLVSPDERSRAETVLRQLGFEPPVRTWLVDEAPHADAWRRRTDGAVIDLH